MVPTYRDEPVMVIPFAPDWSRVSLSVRHGTLTFEALDLSEERIRTFARPLYGIDYTAIALNGQQQGLLRKIFETAEAKVAGVPLWPEAIRITAAAAEGDTVLTVDDDLTLTVHQLFRYAILWSDWDTYEVVEIASLAENAVTIASALEIAWTEGSLLIPFPLGMLARPDFSGLSSETASVRITFEEVFNRELDQFAAEDSGNVFVTGGGDDFQSYTDGDVSLITLDSGDGWAEEWTIKDYSFLGSDDMQSYTDQDPISDTLNGGTLWTGPWSIKSY